MSTNPINPDASRSVEEKEYTIEAIVDFRYNCESHRDEWLIKWKGYGPEDQTWEPFEHFYDCADWLIKTAKDLKALYTTKPKRMTKGQSKTSPIELKAEAPSDDMFMLEDGPRPSGLLFSGRSVTSLSSLPPPPPDSGLLRGSKTSARRPTDEVEDDGHIPQAKKRKIDKIEDVGIFHVESLDGDCFPAVTEDICSPRIVTSSDVTRSTFSWTATSHVHREMPEEEYEKKGVPVGERRDLLRDFRTNNEHDLETVYRNLSSSVWTIEAIGYKPDDTLPWLGDVVLHVLTDQKERLSFSMWELKMGSCESFGLAEKPLLQFFFHQCRARHRRTKTGKDQRSLRDDMSG